MPNYLLLLFVLFFFSCTKELDITTEFDNYLVVNSIFSSDDKMEIQFSKTYAISDSTNDFTDNLKIMLYDNSALVLDTLVHQTDLTTSIVPKENHTYSLKVSSDEYGDIKTEDSMPHKVSINKTALIFPAGVDEYGSYWGESQITFTDPANEENYYELLVYTGVGNYWNDFSEYTITDPVILNEGDVDYHPTSIFFSDELINGETYTMSIKGSMSVQINDEGVKPLGELYAELRSVSKNYYLYRKYLTRHLNNQQVAYSDIYDFLYSGEPVDMYTNVENGYGIFAGYVRSIKQIDF